MRFCLNCGAEIAPSAAGAQTNFAANSFSGAPTAPAGKSGGKWLLVAASAVVIAFLLGGGLIASLLWLSRGNAAKQVAATNKTAAKTTAANNRRANANSNTATTSSSGNNAANASSSSASTDDSESTASGPSINSGQTAVSDVADKPTEIGSFEVAADGEWQLSDIKVVPLEEFVVSVEGEIELAEIKKGVSSKGLTDSKSKSRRLYPEHPTGALLMRTKLDAGGYSNVVAVTAQNRVGVWTNHKDERGKLEFAINDNAPADNTGEFTVHVIMASAPE